MFHGQSKIREWETLDPTILRINPLQICLSCKDQTLVLIRVAVLFFNMDAITKMIKINIEEFDVTEMGHSAYFTNVDAEYRNIICTHPRIDTYCRNRQGQVVSVMQWRLVDYWTKHMKAILPLIVKTTNKDNRPVCKRSFQNELRNKVPI